MIRRRSMALVASLVLALALAAAGCGEPSDAGRSSRTVLTSTQPAAGSQPDPTGQQTVSESQQKPAEQSAAQQPTLREGITQVRVVRVVDGDTIEVEPIAGVALPATRVRLIGVDTPEVHGQREPYGPEASEFTKRQLTGKTVWLEKDVSETDRYGRALRYVWLVEPPSDPTEKQVREGMFNAILVLNGYGQVATYPPDVKYADLFVKFQQEARNADRGLWALDDSSSNKKGASGTSTTKSSAAKSSGKSSGSSSGSRTGKSSSGSSSGGSSKVAKRCDPAYPDVCIPPPPPDLDCGDIPHRGFRVLPPDPHGLDGRDNDGIGCES